MTDVSISDIEGINYSDIDKKIKQISFYIKRVHQRNRAIDNFLKAQQQTKASASFFKPKNAGSSGRLS